MRRLQTLVLVLLLSLVGCAESGLLDVEEASTDAVAPSAISYPEVIPLPDGFQPEGIVVGKGADFYAGSLADGDIYRGDLRTGAGEVVASGPGTPAVGLAFDERSGFLFVAGGPSGEVRIYDTNTGALVAALPAAGAGFINDVVVTRTAAYFTDSFAPALYKLPLGPAGAILPGAALETIPLGGDFVFLAGEFNANGIEATPDGRRLLVVNSGGAALYRVDPSTGLATTIDLGGALPNGDGLVLEGLTLYVVQNFLNQIAEVQLAPDLSSGDIVQTLTSPFFDIPTTAALFGGALYAVNARFGTPPTPTTEYDVVRVAK